MRVFDDWAYRCKAFFGRGRQESELDEELRFHLEMEIERRMAEGEDRASATRAARLDFGAPEAVKEACRDAWGTRLLDETLRDVRAGFRHWKKAPAFSLVVIASLAIGLGAATVIFSLVDAVLLQPVPYDDPSRVVMLQELTPQGDPFAVSDANLRDFDRQSETLEYLAALAFPAPRPSLGTGETRVRLDAEAVSATFFAVLGVEAAHGRTFAPSELEDPPRAVVLTNGAWQRHFGGDPAVVGGEIDLDGEMHTVLGVLPENFRFFTEPEIFLPYAYDDERDRGDHRLSGFARLAPGVSLQEADAEISTIAARLAEIHAETNGGWGAKVEPLTEVWLGHTVRRTGLVLLGAVGLLLLITTVNISHLLLARANDRAHEVRLRLALGAARGRVVRQLITESMLLGLVGAVAGLVLAYWAVPVVRGMGVPLPRMQEMALDLRVFAFVAVIATLSSLACSLLPALRLGRTPIAESLRSRRQGADGKGRRLRSALVVAEVALATVLTVGAGLLLYSFETLRGVDEGFGQDRILLAELDLPPERYPMHRNETRDFYRRLLENLEARPGVVAASVGMNSPFRGPDTINEVATEQERDVHAFVPARWRGVSPSHFRTFGIPLIRGRSLSVGREEPLETVISASVAARFWPGQDPVGQRLRWIHPEGNLFEVVGVAADVRDVYLDAEAPMMVYVSQEWIAWSNTTLAVRSEGSLEALIPAITQTLRQLDPLLARPPFSTLEEQRAEALGQPLLGVRVLATSSLIAVLLAAIGIYGLVAYAVSQRKREMGVRMALGARPGQLIGLMLGDGARLVGMGVGVGMLASLALVETLRALLYGTSPFDPRVLGGATLVLALVGLLASVLPALRAAKVDPIRVLREE